MTDPTEVDVVVIGGGPAGSTLATLVAMQGHRVLVLEKERFPRYQIGESLLPSTIHGVCRLTGVADELAAAGFPKKRGGTFRWGATPEPWTFAFSHSRQMAEPVSFAYQVERSKFDEILLRNAGRNGAQVREECAVIDVVEDGEGRVAGVRYTDAENREQEVRAAFVVDASGNKSRVHQRVGGKRWYSDFFRSIALFGYFEGGKRMPAPNTGNILCVAFTSGWFWYIPLSDTLTSVGAVVRREMAAKIQGDPEQAMAALIEECPMISEYLAPATRVTTGQYGRLRVRKDYSYLQTKFWRPGLVLVGDAACFIDPVFSSGVHLATYSALLAARSINSILGGIVGEEQALAEFEARYRREYGLFYEFLTSFYDMHRDDKSYFWQAKKVTGNSGPELEAFVELIGGVSSGEAALLDADTVAKRLRTNTEELTAAVDAVVTGGDETMEPLMKPGFVRDALAEGMVLEMRAMLGDVGAPDRPRVAGGLVASPDGMFWIPSPQE
ncbi:tryptophan 7-halogenase [Actinocorallia longicatena]|uniref:NAD(P)/FAD-dependent oxidoreductase n=1 Tax=Actinocorallia longicatena TaxID=111803 RepID=A0ABP6QCC6_9ACTN